MSDLFKTPPSSVPGGYMAKLFRSIIKENRYTPATIQRLVRRYAEVGSVTKGDTTRKSTNTISHMSNETMSFKIFVSLLQNVLRVKKLEVNMIVTFRDNSVSSHSEVLNLNDEDDEEEGKTDVKDSTRD